MENKIALIDADSFIYISTHCKKLYDEYGNEIIDDLGNPVKELKTLQDCKHHVDQLLTSTVLSGGFTHYLMFLTVGKNFRYEVYPQYKANRKYSDKPQFFDSIKEYIITKYKAIYNVGYEADDLVLIYKNNIENSFICSADKDILKLEGEHYNYNKGEWVKVDANEASLNFWISMITGDTADNIKGVEGKGPAYANKLFSEGAPSHYPRYVFQAYIDRYGEDKGIEEFYKNYKVLKIVKDAPIDISESIKFEVDEFETGDK